jgi:osmotically inducible protein OsmC
MNLKLKASILGEALDQFEEQADSAKTSCPVSKLLKANISLDAKLL